MKRNSDQYDVIVVGGGPAGLSAGLMLGRCRRNVLVVDEGQPRNAAAAAMHGYLSRDGINPRALLRIGRAELRAYGVGVRRGVVVAASRHNRGFVCRLDDGSRLSCRKLVLATGVIDELPPIEGAAKFYGKSIHHCPYCDGWEWRDQPLAVYGQGKAAVALALKLKTWSDEIAICSNGPSQLRKWQLALLEEHRVSVHTQRIQRLEGARGMLRRILFSDGSGLDRKALFFSTRQRQRSVLAASLGCEFNRKGGVKTDNRERTSVPGLFLAGDASRDVQFVIVAAAEGASAAAAINAELQSEEGLQVQ